MNEKLRNNVRKALRKKRVPSTKEVIRKVKGKGFDDSYIDKEFIKRLERHHVCGYCHKPQYAIIDEVNSKGKIIMSCTTEGCIGNYNAKKSEIKRTNKNLYGRLIDQEMCFDLGKLLLGRDPGRLMVTNKGLVL